MRQSKKQTTKPNQLTRAQTDGPRDLVVVGAGRHDALAERGGADGRGGRARGALDLGFAVARDAAALAVEADWTLDHLARVLIVVGASGDGAVTLICFVFLVRFERGCFESESCQLVERKAVDVKRKKRHGKSCPDQAGSSCS